MDEFDQGAIGRQLSYLQTELSRAEHDYINAKSLGDADQAGMAAETIAALENRIADINIAVARHSPQAGQDIRDLPEKQQDRISLQHLSPQQIEAARICGVAPREYLEGLARQNEAGANAKGQKI